MHPTPYTLSQIMFNCQNRREVFQDLNKASSLDLNTIVVLEENAADLMRKYQ
jgi:hypothetical protein